jgi:hypothetical protein
VRAAVCASAPTRSTSAVSSCASRISSWSVRGVRRPAVAFVVGTAMSTLAPQHTQAQRPLRTVVGRVDAISRCKRLAKRPASSLRVW